MKLEIVQDRKTGPAICAEIELDKNSITIRSAFKPLTKFLESLLPYPTKVKMRSGNKVIKRYPEKPDENLRETLKQNLYYPYSLKNGEDIYKRLSLRYEMTCGIKALYGEKRHHSVKDSEQEI